MRPQKSGSAGGCNFRKIKSLFSRVIEQKNCFGFDATKSLSPGKKIIHLRPPPISQLVCPLVTCLQFSKKKEMWSITAQICLAHGDINIISKQGRTQKFRNREGAVHHPRFPKGGFPSHIGKGSGGLRSPDAKGFFL